MSDLSVTPASVLPGAGATTDKGIAGGTITAGMPVYKAADGTILATDATTIFNLTNDLIIQKFIMSLFHCVEYLSKVMLNKVRLQNQTSVVYFNYIQ